MTHTRLLLLAVVLFVPLRALHSAPGAAFGVGAYPLSQTTVSMWLLRTDSAAKPLPVLLVYFTGAQGWHNRKWESKFDGNIKEEGRTHYCLVSQDVTLDLAISEDKQKAWIQDREFELEQSNVYVVRNADGAPKKETIVALGHFDLPYSNGQPLAVLVLRNHPELEERLK